MINLRDYQKEAIAIIKETFDGCYRQYIEMPTGSGKTVTFLSYAKENHKCVLIIVPSVELLNQVYETALLFYSKSEISRKGNRYDEDPKRLHISTIQSLRGEYLQLLHKYPHDLIIIDEAHHAQAESYKRFIRLKTDYYHEKCQRFLGVTATPDRADGQLLNDILYKCSYRIKIQDLIEREYLSDIEGFSVKTNIDLSGIHDHNSDFSIIDLYKKLCVDSRNQMIVDLCKKEMIGKKNLIFCINIQHSKEINKMLNDQGLSSKHIDGKMNDIERHSILKSFRNGEISFLTNCQLLTEGFDEPSIDGIILARPTKSISLFIQMIGRGLRIYPSKKTCKIIDIVDNHKLSVGFNNLVDEEKYNHIKNFKSIKDIINHVHENNLQLSEITIERVDLLGLVRYKDNVATPSMIDYLEKNDICFLYPLSFEEGCFLVWKDKLQKEYLNGNYNRKL